jgi:hypothetical protein
MNKFIESIGAEGYEVIEENGVFTLEYEGDYVASSNTAKGIYKEFCWYEGVGEGDANYKVYLNLTNPLVVDAEGRNWNDISREYSQEIADKYNSLTTEEKATLHDLAGWGEISIFRDQINDAVASVENGRIGALNDAHTKNLAAAHYKLEGANVYDMFSIAEDNFSEESIKQFAMKQMKTRDYAQRAKEGGYDGVIFKNIHDNGGYSNGSEGASTVAIAFSSEQVKSVANEKPTGDPDIRYSLSAEGETPKKYGNYHVRGEDIKYNPAQETVGETVSPTDTPTDTPTVSETDDVAPVAETTAENTLSAILYNKRDGANGWGEVYGTAQEALNDAVKHISPELWDAFSNEFDNADGKNPVTPITNALIAVQEDVRQETITPMQGAQLLAEAYNHGGVNTLKRLYNPKTGNLYDAYLERAKQYDTVAPVAEDVPDIIDDVPDIEPREPSLQELKQRQE